MRRWVPVVFILAGLLVPALQYSRLPDRVIPDWGVLIPWLPASTEAMPRWFVAFGLPGIAVLGWLLLRGVASPTGERWGRRILPAWLVSERTGSSAVDRFGPTFDVIVAAVVLGVVLFHLVILGTVLGWPRWTAQGFTALIGLGLVVVGNIMPRTRPNWVAGLRTRATLSHPDIWRRVHRWFGALLMVTGLAVVGISFVTAPVALVVAAAGGLGSAVLATLVAGRPGIAVAVLALTLTGTGHLAAQGAGAVSPAGAGYREEAFSVSNKGLVLPGTLTIPAEARGPYPVAVIVAGSGPTDRNGNGPLTQTDLYAQLAHGLAARGIASVRYDKRAIGEVARTLDHAAMTLEDFVGDVLAAASAVESDSRFSRVFLVGHSEGAGLVLQAANRGAKVSGIAMLSGTGRPLVEVMHDQFAQIVDATSLVRIDSLIARFLRGEEVADVPEVARPVMVPFYRRLMASMAAYDPAAEMAKVPVPALIVQGGTDLQVTAADAERLKAANPRAAWLLIPNANHVFKYAPSRDPASQTPLYRNTALPIVPELVEGIAEWVESVGRGR
jgi:alpha-beta hydrolase superfamily lysophospholipase